MASDFFSYVRLDRLGDRLAADVEEGVIAGADLLVGDRDGELRRRTVGFRDIVRGDRLGSDAIWRIYSMTKVLVSASTLVLAEQGRLRLDQPVADVIPAFADLSLAGTDGRREPMRTPPTIQDLLRHTAGLGYGYLGADIAHAPYYPPGPGYGFGLGVAVRLRAGEAPFPGSVGDWTWSGVGGTYFWVDPPQGFYTLLMLQTSSAAQRQHYRTLTRVMVYAALNRRAALRYYGTSWSASDDLLMHTYQTISPHHLKFHNVCYANHMCRRRPESHAWERGRRPPARGALPSRSGEPNEGEAAK